VYSGEVLIRKKKINVNLSISSLQEPMSKVSQTYPINYVVQPQKPEKQSRFAMKGGFLPTMIAQNQNKLPTEHKK
jgi:hypothetical protein